MFRGLDQWDNYVLRRNNRFQQEPNLLFQLVEGLIEVFVIIARHLSRIRLKRKSTEFPNELREHQID
jgi:hypothetical protein